MRSRRGTGWMLLACAIACALGAYFIADDSERRLLANTARLVFEVERCTLPIAALLAFLIARTNLVGRRTLLLLCGSLLFIPLYLQLAGWDAAFGRQGWHTFLFQRLSEPLLSKWRGAVFVHTIYAIPWATCLMAALFSRGDRDQEEAALLDGAPWQVLLRVTLPQLASGVAVAAVWVLVITAGEMTVTNIYLVSIYAEDVYNFYAPSGDIQGVAVHLLPLLLFTASLMLALLSVVQPGFLQTATSLPYRWRLGRAQLLLVLLTSLLVFALVVVPLANLVERMGEDVVSTSTGIDRTWSPAKVVRMLVTAPAKFGIEFSVTALIGVTVALVATSLSLAAAWLSRIRPSLSITGWLLSAIAMALPGPVIGIAVIWLLNWNTPIHIYLYDETIVPPVLAILIRVLPLTFIALWFAMQTLDREPFDAAALEGAGSFWQLLAIALPQRWPVVAAAAIAAFVLASGDLAASILTLPPKLYGEPIARRMFGLIHAGVYDEVAAIGFISWLGYLACAAAVFRIVRIADNKLYS